MLSKIIFIVFVGIMLGLGLFFIIYGIKGGLIEKRILASAWRHEFVTGHDAVIRGWFYIVVGSIFIIILAYGVLDALRE